MYKMALPGSLEVRHEGRICVARATAGSGGGDHGKGALLLGADHRRGPQRQRAAHGSTEIAVARGSLRHSFLTRSGSRKAREIGRTGRLSVLYQHDADDGYVTLIGRGVIVADRALLRARWQPAWNHFFPAGANDEISIFVQLEAERIELWVRGVTAEPFGARGAILERDPGQPWRLVEA